MKKPDNYKYEPDSANPYIVLENLEQAFLTMQLNGFIQTLDDGETKYYRNTETNQKAIIFKAINSKTKEPVWLVEYS